MKKPRIILYDIETTPILGYAWELYDTSILSVVEPWKLLAFSYKVLGEKKVHVFSRRKYTERQLVKKLWKVLNGADLVISHNGNQFDNKKAQDKFAHFNLGPPAPLVSVDTRAEAKRHFKFSSNSLDNLADYLSIGRKLQTGGFDLWKRCMRGELKALLKMERYNKQDVRLLEKVYLRLRPWMSTHPNLTLLKGRLGGCPKCGSNHLQARGFRYTQVNKFQRYQCQSCGGWTTSRKAEPKLEVT